MLVTELSLVAGDSDMCRQTCKVRDCLEIKMASAAPTPSENKLDVDQVEVDAGGVVAMDALQQ